METYISVSPYPSARSGRCECGIFLMLEDERPFFISGRSHQRRDFGQSPCLQCPPITIPGVIKISTTVAGTTEGTTISQVVGQITTSPLYSGLTLRPKRLQH